MLVGWRPWLVGWSRLEAIASRLKAISIRNKEKENNQVQVLRLIAGRRLHLGCLRVTGRVVCIVRGEVVADLGALVGPARRTGGSGLTTRSKDSTRGSWPY